MTQKTAEHLRLEAQFPEDQGWKKWGPYLSERQWGTVREDYSPHGNAWDYLPHDHARSRAYRWGEDGIGGFSDRHGLVCLAPAFWNGRDPILKERLFGLSGPEGNHGEDAKEYWFYLDGIPTHAYMRMLYKYPQGEFPYRALVEESARRTRFDPEFELLDTGACAASRYWGIFVTYATASPADLLVTIEAVKREPETASLHVLPTLWFRNTWSWGLDARLPRLAAAEPPPGAAAIAVHHPYYGERTLYVEGAPDLLFTDNITNARLLFGAENEGRFVKDAFHERVVHGAEDAVNPAGSGTKAAAWFRWDVPAGASR